MEHDIEKTIREKISVVERKSVKWEKDGAWNKINAELRPKKKTALFYYVAASFVLALVLLIPSLQLFKQKNLDQKIKSLELAIANSHPKLKDEQIVLLPNCMEENSTVVVQKKINPLEKEKDIEKIYPVLNTVATIEQGEEIPVSQTEMEVLVTEPTPLPKITIAANPNRVEPIIGVIIPEKETMLIAKEKKIKLRLFKSPEKDIDRKEEDSKILFARIN